MNCQPVVRAGPLGFYASCGIAGPWRDDPVAARDDLRVLAAAVADARRDDCAFTFATHAFRVGYGDGPIPDEPGPRARAALALLDRTAG